MFVCNYDRKNFIDDHRQKYVEITKNCLGNEIADKRLRFLQTKHLQCLETKFFFLNTKSIKPQREKCNIFFRKSIPSKHNVLKV